MRTKQKFVLKTGSTPVSYIQLEMERKRKKLEEDRIAYKWKAEEVQSGNKLQTTYHKVHLLQKGETERKPLCVRREDGTFINNSNLLYVSYLCSQRDCVNPTCLIIEKSAANTGRGKSNAHSRTSIENYHLGQAYFTMDYNKKSDISSHESTDSEKDMEQDSRRNKRMKLQDDENHPISYDLYQQQQEDLTKQKQSLHNLETSFPDILFSPSQQEQPFLDHQANHSNSSSDTLVGIEDEQSSDLLIATISNEEPVFSSNPHTPTNPRCVEQEDDLIFETSSTEDFLSFDRWLH